MSSDYKEQIKHIVLDEEQFVRLTMKDQIREPLLPWRQVVVRPVLIKNEQSPVLLLHTETRYYQKLSRQRGWREA